MSVAELLDGITPRTRSIQCKVCIFLGLQSAETRLEWERAIEARLNGKALYSNRTILLGLNQAGASIASTSSIHGHRSGHGGR